MTRWECLNFTLSESNIENRFKLAPQILPFSIDFSKNLFSNRQYLYFAYLRNRYVYLSIQKNVCFFLEGRLPVSTHINLMNILPRFQRYSRELDCYRFTAFKLLCVQRVSATRSAQRALTRHSLNSTAKWNYFSFSRRAPSSAAS